MSVNVCVVFREEWDWIQTLSAVGDKDHTREESEEAEPRAESHAPLLYYELQTAIKSLLNHINLPLHQVRAPAAADAKSAVLLLTLHFNCSFFCSGSSLGNLLVKRFEMFDLI